MDPKPLPPSNSSDDPLAPGQQPDLSQAESTPEPAVPTPGTSIVPTPAQSDPEPAETVNTVEQSAAVEPPASIESPAPPVQPVATNELQPEESPDLPPQPPVLNKRIFTPPPEELLQKPSRKKRYIIIAALAILLLGGVGAYFGYYVPNKPENMWKSALVNTGKGYDKLVSYSENTKTVKNWSQEARFNIDGMIEVDGTLKGESSGSAATMNGDVSFMGTKVGFDVRTLPSATETPDVYFKVDGLEGIGTLFAQDDPMVETALNNLNNQWYVVDHTLFEQMEGAAEDPAQAVTTEDVVALFKKIGVTSKEYVFTDDTEKAAVVVKEQVGRETKYGRSVYHYTIDSNDKQAKKYVTALCNDVKASKIGQVFTDSLGEDAFDCEQKNAQQGDVRLKEEDLVDAMPGYGASAPTEYVVDAWVDTKTKLIQSIRFSDKKDKKEYIEISQNFTGGDEMPFKLEVRSEEGGTDVGMTLDATFNTKTQAVNAKGKFSAVDPSNDENNTQGDFSYSMKPTRDEPKIDKPEGAKNIIELLNALGVGDLLSGDALGMFGGAQTQAEDADMKNNLKMLQMRLETYYNDKGFYPSLTQMNAEKWFDTRLGADTEETGYGYVPKSEAGGDCNGTTIECQTYQLTVLLASGDTYVLDSINP